MKTRYKYIHFQEVGASWWCQNNRTNSIIGYVEWYPAWRQFIYEPLDDTLYSADCLADIQDFIGQITARRK